MRGCFAIEIVSLLLRSRLQPVAYRAGGVPALLDPPGTNSHLALITPEEVLDEHAMGRNGQPAVYIRLLPTSRTWWRQTFATRRPILQATPRATPATPALLRLPTARPSTPKHAHSRGCKRRGPARKCSSLPTSLPRAATLNLNPNLPSSLDWWWCVVWLLRISIAKSEGSCCVTGVCSSKIPGIPTDLICPTIATSFRMRTPT